MYSFNPSVFHTSVCVLGTVLLLASSIRYYFTILGLSCHGGTEPKLHSEGGCAHHGPGAQRDVWELEVKGHACHSQGAASVPARQKHLIFVISV